MVEPTTLSDNNNDLEENSTVENEELILPIEQCKKIFQNTLGSALNDDECPFAKAPFLENMAFEYLGHTNKDYFFAESNGFGANIILNPNNDYVAIPSISLNVKEALKSKNLIKRIKIRLNKEELTPEEFFTFAVGHELGHLVQCLAPKTDKKYYSEDDIKKIGEKTIEKDVKDYNEKLRENKEIKNAQEYFRSVFKTDINRSNHESYIDSSNYTKEDYLKYVNSSTEANADFISLWLMGISNPDMEASPQKQGYSIEEWERWAEDHKITVEDID